MTNQTAVQRRLKYNTSHVVINPTKTGVKYVSVPSNYFLTLNLEGGI